MSERAESPRKNGRPVADIARTAVRRFGEMVGRPTEGLAGLTREDDGWSLRVDVVELERIPHSTDVLATYELHVTDDGDIEGFERQRRFFRNQGGDA